MKNENQLTFSFGTTDKKKIKRYLEFLRKIHAMGKQVFTMDLSKNTVAKIKTCDELQKNVRFIARENGRAIIGAFFYSVVLPDDKAYARFFINNDVADLFFSLPAKDFLYHPIRSKYAKLIYDKIDKKQDAGGFITVPREEIIRDWKINTNAKMSQFILRLPLYVNEINGSGLLDGELHFSIARASEKKQSRMLAVLFQAENKGKGEVLSQSENKNESKRPPESPQSDDKEAVNTEIPAAKQYTREDEGALLCPVCGGKVVHCVAKNGKTYECCEHSKYNINVPIPERGQCNGYYKE